MFKFVSLFSSFSAPFSQSSTLAQINISHPKVKKACYFTLQRPQCMYPSYTHTHIHTLNTDQAEVKADTLTPLMIHVMRMRRADRFCFPKDSCSSILSQKISQRVSYIYLCISNMRPCIIKILTITSNGWITFDRQGA